MTKSKSKPKAANRSTSERPANPVIERRCMDFSLGDADGAIGHELAAFSADVRMQFSQTR
jgi:hypothetical protein